MILSRLGNKRMIASKLLQYFPPHTCYIEPFFGGGGMFFYKPKAKYNFLNDIDADVYNLFRQVLDNKDELLYWIERTPVEEKQFKEWVRGKREKSNVLNAVRFLWLSNFALYGSKGTLRFVKSNTRKMIINRIDKTFLKLQFEVLENYGKKGMKWAMSEFEHPFVLEQVKSRNLHITIICERKNLKNRCNEILISNYEVQKSLFTTHSFAKVSL